MIPCILIIQQDPFGLLKGISESIGNMAHIHVARTGLDGLIAFDRFKPMLVIIDNDLPDMRGESVASIIKDTDDGEKSTVYVVNIVSLLQNSKADQYISKPLNEQVFIGQIHQDLQKKLLLNQHADEIEKAVAIQKGTLPPTIRTDQFEVFSLFSPYATLSGDGIFYWHPKKTEQKDCLYGFLFDCTGHDISSYGQTGSLRLNLQQGMRRLQREEMSSLSEVMNAVNEDIFEFSSDAEEPNMSAAISFYIDFVKQELHYSPAGNPEIQIRRKGEAFYESIKLVSSPLGYLPDEQYKEYTRSLKNISDIVFASDGLSELFLKNQYQANPIDTAKHDDVSAIFIHINHRK